MQYKTIALELLQQQTELHEQLRASRSLMPTLERCATELKASHQTWKETLSLAKSGSNPTQVASEAMELAIQELEGRLRHASQAVEPHSLDKAMAYVRSHSSHG